MGRQECPVLRGRRAPREVRGLPVHLDPPVSLECLVQLAALEHRELQGLPDRLGQLDLMVHQELLDQLVYLDLRGYRECREVRDLLVLWERLETRARQGKPGLLDQPAPREPLARTGHLEQQGLLVSSVLRGLLGPLVNLD